MRACQARNSHWNLRSAALAVALLAAGCDNSSDDIDPTAAQGKIAVTFTEVESRILGPKCVGCHMSPNGADGVNLDSFAAIQATAETHSHPIVEPGNPGASHLIDSLESGEMPPGGPRLSEAEIDTISTWIIQGALDN